MPPKSTAGEPILRSIHHRLHEFDPNSYDWEEWEVLFDTYLEVENITDDTQKKNLLITALGVQPFKTLITICKPKKPTECTFTELVENLRSNYTRVTFPSTERVKFFAQRQQSSQTLTDFANDLRAKSTTCKFPSNFYEEALITAFVGGLQNNHVRRHLMQHKLETFTDTINIAKTINSVLVDGTQNRVFQSDESTVNKITEFREQSTNPQHKTSCASCGSTDHPRSKCRFRNVTCHKCNKQGHIAKVCRSKGNSDQLKVNTISSALHSHSTGDIPIQILIKIGGIDVKFELDTGSPSTIITEHIWKLIGKPKLNLIRVAYNSFSGHPIFFKGEVLVNVHYNGQNSQLNLFVGNKNRNNILGRNWIEALHLNKIPLEKIGYKTNNVINVNQEINKLKKMMIHYNNIFNDTSRDLKQQLKDVQNLLCSTIINPSNRKHSINQDNKVYIGDFRGASTKVKSTPTNHIHCDGYHIKSTQSSDNEDNIIDDHMKSQLEHGICSTTSQRNSYNQETRTLQVLQNFKKKKKVKRERIMK